MTTPVLEADTIATMPDSLDLTATSVNTRKLPGVQIVAYTGGTMTVPQWGLIAIDLTGLELGQVPILADHESRRSGVLGHGQAEVRDNRLIVTGTISAMGPAAAEIVEAARNGFPWQASVGVQVIEAKRLPGGQSIEINGRRITAPDGGLMLVERGRLREVSITSLGCDGDTEVSIAASRQKGFQPMETNDTDVATATENETTEAQRIEAITELCGDKYPHIQAQAVAEGWDETRTELAVLRASRPKIMPAFARHPVAPTGAIIEAALLTRMGKTDLGERTLGPDTMERADDLGATSLLELCRAALQADDQTVPVSRMELVRAALSTYSLPTALGNVANKVLLDSYRESSATWRAFCAVRSVADFKTHTTVRPTFTGQLEQVPKGGEIKHGGIDEATAEYAIDTFAKMLSIDRRDVINDDLGLFQDTASALGRMAMRRLSDLVYEVLLSNPSAFFSTGNANLLSGADSVLNMDSLGSAITTMRSQRDDEGNDLDLKPATLLVGPQLEATARALLESEFIQRAEDVPTGNSLRRAVNLEVEPRLANTVKFPTGASNKHWYLFAEPSALAMVVAFLNGRQAPTLEQFGLDQDVNRLALSWRCYFDFGCAMIDPRAAVRSKGEA